MDKAHQKELQKNDLEAGLEKVASTVRPYYLPLALVAVVLIIAAVGYMLYERSVRATNTAAWSKWAAAVFDRDANPEVLRRVSEDLGDTPASRWALQLAADEELRQGSFLIYEDREGAQERLESAVELYEKVIKGSGDDPMLQIRARYGAAQANECLFKIDAAIELYQQIVDSEAGSGALAKAAEERLQVLKNPETRDFYKWFASTEPYKPLPSGAGGSGGLNSFPSLPDVPNFSIPGTETPGTTPPSTTPAAPPAGDTPPTEEKPPAERESTPSRFGDKPGEEDPPPAEEKPAEEKPAEPEPSQPEPTEPQPSEPQPTEPKPPQS